MATASTDAIWAALCAGLRPDPVLTVSEWADRHRVLSSRAASEAGPYRTDRTPYMRAIMDDLASSSPVERVVFMKAAQVGATEAGNNWIGYVIHHAPGPMLAVQPTTETAKRNSQQRIDPLIEESPDLRKLVAPSRSRDSGNTVLAKKFPGGQLILAGANSAVGLRSMPARYVFLDEVDAYPGDVDGEGDPVSLAEARTATFGHRKKIFIASTPTVSGASRIEREYEQSDQRRYYVPCPFCKVMQWLQFTRLRWEKGAPDGAAYHCEGCERAIPEHHKTAMLEAGEWRPTATARHAKIRGYHISALYSPVGWKSWASIADAWENAQGDDAELKVVKNTLLGEVWQERGDAPDWQRLYDRREPYQWGTCPRGVLFLTAGVDVQHDRLEASVWGWGRGMSSWLVEHRVIYGRPDAAETWEELDWILDETWQHASGSKMAVQRMAIDAGDGSTSTFVYAYARRHGPKRVMAIKGNHSFDRSTPVSGPTKVDVTERGRKVFRGAHLWAVAVSVFKSELYSWLRQDRVTDEEAADGKINPPGYVHIPGGADAEWCKQLVSEQLITTHNRRGFGKLEWSKVRDRNEALDCRVYARAATWHMGCATWSEERWLGLERQLGKAAKPAEMIAATPAEVATMPPAVIAGDVRGAVPVRRRGMRGRVY